ncbi:MAG: ribosomal-processing cysteine protease Prp [Candidatus Muiribacteriota bacterium]
MIEIKINLEGDLIKQINIKGHAEYDVTGKDIVCAGVSAVFFAGVNSLKSILGNNSQVFKITAKKGSAQIKLIDPEPTSQLIAKVVYIGLKNIENEYKEFVKIEEDYNGT